MRRPDLTRPDLTRIGRALPRRSATLLLASALATACGGGSDDTSVSAAPPAPAPAPAAPAAPADKTAAVAQQYRQVAEARAAVEAILAGDERALQALAGGRPAEWNRYWSTEYPALVDRLDRAASSLSAGERHVQTLVYGLPAAVGAEGPVVKSVPIPIVLLAIGTLTFIAKGELERRARQRAPSTPSEGDAQIALLQRFYERQGLTPVAARTRAIADSLQVDTLKGLQTGIEHSKQLATDQVLTPGVSTMLPDGISNLLDLKEIGDQLGEIGANLEAILTSKECRTVVPPETKAAALDPENGGIASNRFAGPIEKASGVCRIYFCSPAADRCANVPSDEWEAAVFAPAHLRDADLDVTTGDGATTTLQGTLLPVGSLENPPPIGQCSSVQNAGGDRPDTRTIPLGATSGTFRFSHEMFGIRDRIRILHDGLVLLDTGCVSGRATRMLSFSGLASFVSVEVLPNCSGTTSGTAWNYTLACPGS